ncbi:GNAT family N-acetyltransferase [soil metagenome]
MDSRQITVRQIEEKDISGWFRLRKLLWDQSTDDEHRAEMSDIYRNMETQLVVIAENSDGNLIAFLEASIRPFVEDCETDAVGYLEGWFVETDYRQSGIGGKLVASAENWARKRGCTEMASDSEIGNDLSLRVHQSLGYEETSRLIHLRKDLI